MITIASNESFTDSNKMAWDNYKTVSKKGYTLTGKYSFLSVNVKRLKAGLNPFKIPGTEFTLSE
jgi:hypothetical protein